MVKILIILNICRKIKFNFLYYIIAFISVITGLFKEFIIFSAIIFVHEMGHVLMALYYNWKIDKILIMPFGGLTIFKDIINKPIKEEFLIAISGPLFQILFYMICNLLNIVNPTIINYHYAILLFNLLPIYPLDGGKLVNLFLNNFLPFKISHLIIIYLSFINIIIGLIISYYYKLEIVITIIIIFIICKLYDELKKHQYIFNKFLFERYFYSLKFNKNKTINGNNINKMYRDYSHLFKINGKHFTEREILRKKFDNTKRLW